MQPEFCSREKLFNYFNALCVNHLPNLNFCLFIEFTEIKGCFLGKVLNKYGRAI